MGRSSGITSVARRCAALGLALGLLGATDARAENEATSLQVNPTHDGFQRLEPTRSPQRLWSIKLGTRASQPLIAEGMMFVLSADRDGGVVLSALDSETGRTVWSRLADGGVLAYDEGRVFVAGGFGKISAIDASTGVLDWAGSYGRRSGDGLVADDGVLWSTDGFSGDIAYKIDAVTGDYLDTVGLAEGAANTTPAVSEEGIFSADGCGGAERSSLAGDLVWETFGENSGCSADSFPVLGGDRLYARYSDTVPASASTFAASDGAELGSFASSTPPAIAGRTALYVEGGRLVARDVASGSRLWSFGWSSDPILAAPIIVGDRIAVASESGAMAWLRLQDGAVVSRFAAGAPTERLAESDGFLGGGGLSAAEGVLAASASGRISAFSVGPVEDRVARPLVPGATAPPSAPTRNAVAYRQNAAHDGANESARVNPPLRALWTLRLGDRVGYPLIVGQRIYALATRRDGNLRVYALRRGDGRTLWSRQIDYSGEEIFGQERGLAYDDGKVVVVGDELHALDARTGNVLWSTSSNFGFNSPPVADDGFVFVTGGAVNAFDLDTGDLVWQGSTQGGDHSSPAIEGDRVIVTFACNVNRAFDRETGAELWRGSQACTGSLSGKTPSVRNGQAYGVAYGPGGAILDVTSGDYAGDYPGYGIPALGKRLNLVVVDETLYAYERETGRLAWRYRGSAGLRYDPVIAGSIVYVTGDGRRLYALRLSDGRPLWQTRTRTEAQIGSPGFGDMAAGMAVAGNTLVVPQQGGLMTAYGPKR